MNPLIEKQDEEQLTDQAGDAMVRTYLQKKYGVAPKEAQSAMETGNSNVGAEALEATPHKYDRIAQDDSSIRQAKQQAASQRLSSGLFDAMHTAFGGKEGAFDKHYAAADKVVADARADKQEKLGGILTSDKLKRQEAGDKRAAVEQGRVDQEYNRTRDPASTTSKWAQVSVKANLKNKVGEAKLAGDQAAAAELDSIAANIDQYSAHDLANLQALKDVSYKDMLNNQAAMARVRTTEAGANSRANKAKEAEDRRLKQQSFGMHKSLRDEVWKDPEMRKAAIARESLDKLDQAMSQGNSFGDEAMLMVWNKILDPTSVVRETEFARSSEGKGLLQDAQTKLNMWAGKGRMPDNLRLELIAAAKALASGHRRYADAKLQTIDNTIKQFELEPGLVYSGLQEEMAGRGTGKPQLDGEDEAMIREARATLADPDQQAEHANAKEVLRMHGVDQ